MTNKSPSFFGAVVMADDPLTVGPDPVSKLVGKAQGIYAFALQDEIGLLMVMNLEFSEGKYNGSTLSLLGRNAVFSAVREMPIVGGSKMFRTTITMAKSKTLFTMIFVPFILILLFTALTAATEQPSFDQEISPTSLNLGKEKLSHLHFFFHDILSGTKPSAVRVAQANMTSNSPTNFGAVVITDDPLTVGPDPGSKLVGKGQGMYAFASQEDIELLMVMNFEFSEGKYNGSTLSLLGRNAVLTSVREMPIVGGSGVFRFARGYAEARTQWLNQTTGDAIVEFNIYVFHY